MSLGLGFRVFTMLEKLLAQGQAYDVFTKTNGFSNHLPMTLIALERLGASNERLMEFFVKYSSNLKDIDPSSLSKAFAWDAHLGEENMFQAYLTFYANEIDQLGIDTVINTYIDRLIVGCAASAFHALIRLSYGVLQRNPKEVAFGLAHLSSHHVEMPKSSMSTLLLDAIFHNAADTFASHITLGETIAKKIVDIKDHPSLGAVNFYPALLTLESISDFFTRLYLRTNDFTVLHGVTSCHAMRVLLTFVENKDAAIRSYWTAALVSVLSINELKIAETPGINIVPIEDLDLESVINSNDDHLIKLVFSCLSEYQAFGNVNHLKILNTKVPLAKKWS